MIPLLSGGFSEMAADEQLRWSFAKGCKRVIDEYGLDGIDMGYESTRHSSLYTCAISKFTCETAIKRHLEVGMPIDKLVMGMPFYARGVGKYSVVRYGNINSMKEEDGLEECWEPDGCVPYIRNKDGNIVMTYDNPRSISLKCKYIKEKGLRGGMYWVY